jgi:NAD(P)-dependent dehydrogenase (short-subunit alcohol dehydrogenase family)
MDEMSYRDQVVVVTGAGRGLGAEYARAFAARGAAVVVNDLGTSILGDETSAEPAAAVAEEIRGRGGRAVATFGSVATQEGAAETIDAAISEFGRLDTLVNNAGIIRMRPFEEVTIEGIQQHLDVHLLGTVRMTKAAWPHLAERGTGRVVNTISGGIFGLPSLCEYGPAKGAVFALTRSLALEASQVGIHVNAVAPQGSTRMLKSAGLAPELRAELDRLMRPELVVPAVLFLGHKTCELNGETLAASGGTVCRIALTYNDGITDPSLTPETIRDRIDEVMDTTSTRVWTNANDRYSDRASTG